MLAALLAAASPAALAEPACPRLPQAEQWLAGQAKRWEPTLAAQPGYERPPEFTVCRASRGRPYTDYANSRIYLRQIAPDEDRLTLAHEYIHLAFRFHPSSRDEGFVEATARRLLKEYP